MNARSLKQPYYSYQRHENTVHDGVRYEAHQGFLRAGKNGYSMAAFQLGNHYLVAKDATKAIRWYQRAAKAGHAVAQYNLGLMYLKGKDVPRNALKGLGWIEKAVDRGDKKAQELLQRIDRALVGR